MITDIVRLMQKPVSWAEIDWSQVQAINQKLIGRRLVHISYRLITGVCALSRYRLVANQFPLIRYRLTRSADISYWSVIIYPRSVQIGPVRSIMHIIHINHLSIGQWRMQNDQLSSDHRSVCTGKRYRLITVACTLVRYCLITDFLLVSCWSSRGAALHGHIDKIANGASYGQ